MRGLTADQRAFLTVPGSRLHDTEVLDLARRGLVSFEGRDPEDQVKMYRSTQEGQRALRFDALAKANKSV